MPTPAEQNAAPYRLYYSPDSANLVVRIALEAMELDYEDVLVPPRRTLRNAEFLRLNPTGLVPVLVDRETDRAIAETAAILLYLSDKHGRLHVPAADPAGRAGFLTVLFHLSNTLHADLRVGMYTDRFVEDGVGLESVRRTARQRVLRHLSVYEDWIGRPDMACLDGEALSVCDIYLACLCRWARIYPQEDPVLEQRDLEGFPRLLGLLERLQHADPFRRAAAREEIAEPIFTPSPSPPDLMRSLAPELR